MFNDIGAFINKVIHLSFNDDKFETQFKSEYVIDNLFQNKLSIIITLIAYILYLPISYIITPDDFFKDLILMLFLPILSSIVYLFTIDKITDKQSIFLFFYSISITIPPIISICYTSKYYQIYINNYTLVVIGVMVIYGAFFFITFLSVLLVNLFATILLFIKTINSNDVIYNLFYINIIFIVTTIASYFIERSKRRIYEKKYELIRNNEQMLKKDKLIQQKIRMAQMGEMISMIAHQWRQPLSSMSISIINMDTKFKSKKYDLGVLDEQEKFLKYIEKKHKKMLEQIEYLSNTVDDFRNFFKPDKKQEKKSIVETVKKSLRIIDASLGNYDIEIKENFVADKEIWAFHNEVMQVLLNILKNSKDNFIEKNIKNRIINIKTYRFKDNYFIGISDNGGGISENIIDKVFDPYFSTKDEKNGSGLGLYMSKIIIEEHNKGKLTVENIDDGVCFKIILTGEKL